MTDQHEPPDGRDPFDPYGDLSHLTGADALPALEDPSVPAAVPPKSPLLTGLIVALLLIVLSISIFQLLRNDDDTPATAGTPTATTAGSTTAAPDATPGVPTTIENTTPTSGSPATTVAVSVPGSFEPYTASGDAIAIPNLAMKVDGLGPISFGTGAREAMGRLIASLGEPDEDTGPVVSTGAYGSCATKLARTVRWGPFVAVVVIDDDSTEIFGGYRLDFAYAVEGLGSPATELETLSGLKAGMSVVALQDIYKGFQVTYEVIADLGTTFQLRSSSSGNLLLWGPVTSDDSNGIVLGIYAPDACGRFQ